MKVQERYRMNGSLLRSVRRTAGVSLRGLAQELRLSHTTIQRLEHGKDISAKAYLALMYWVTMNHRNIT